MKDKKTNNYVRYGVKASCLDEARAWYKGESKGLDNLIGAGFYNHLFICEDGEIDFFYDHEEWKNFHKKLKKILDDDFFDKICADYIFLINKINCVFTKKEIDDIAVKLWVIQAIFNEIDEIPEMASQYILNKLLKIRRETHVKHYELEKKRKKRKDPRNYIYFKGQLYIRKEK